MKNLEVKTKEFVFKTNEFINGIIINLIDNNPYNSLTVDIRFDNLYVGSYEVPHLLDITDDHLGRTTVIFKTLFEPIKTTKMIRVMIKTKLFIENDFIKVKLLTN